MSTRCLFSGWVIAPVFSSTAGPLETSAHSQPHSSYSLQSLGSVSLHMHSLDISLRLVGHPYVHFWPSPLHSSFHPMSCLLTQTLISASSACQNFPAPHSRSCRLVEICVVIESPHQFLFSLGFSS